MRGVEAFGAGCLEVGCLEVGFLKLGSGYRVKRLMLGIRHQRRLLIQDVLYGGRVGETAVPGISQCFLSSFLFFMNEPIQEEKANSPRPLR